MQQANPTVTAVIQLATFVFAVGAVITCAALHLIDSTLTGALLMGSLAHAGIIAYNGATKGSPGNGSQGQ